MQNQKTTYTILPKTLPIKKLGRQYTHISGHVNLKSFTRFQDFLAKNMILDQDILVDLEFKELANNKIVIHGHINHDVIVECQRCLGDLPFKINSKIAVVLIDILSRIDKNLSDYEIIEFTPDEEKDNMLDIYSLIEDELILSLPSAAKHNDEADCNLKN